MPHLLRKAAHRVLSTTLQYGGDNDMQRRVASLLELCEGLKSSIYQMLLQAVLHGVLETGLSGEVVANLPSLANWQLPPPSPT